MAPLKAIPQNQFQNCFEGWTKRWHRCIASQGEYFEGDHGGIQQWITHIESIKNKLSSACYGMSLVKPYVTANTLKVIYYSYFHSIMTYGLIFWGTPQTVLRFSVYKRRLSKS